MLFGHIGHRAESEFLGEYLGFPLPASSIAYQFGKRRRHKFLGMILSGASDLPIVVFFCGCFFGLCLLVVFPQRRGHYSY